MRAILTSIVILLLAGCSTYPANNPKTLISDVTSSPPGAEIEVDNKVIGRTPNRIQWRGNAGRFFNDSTHVVKAYLECAGCCPQVNLYSGSAVYSANDIIPRRIHFDMRKCDAADTGQGISYTR